MEKQQFLGAYEVSNITKDGENLVVELKDAPNEELTQQAFDYLVKEEKADHGQYLMDKRLYIASEVYQTLVKNKVTSMEEAQATLIRASQELATRFDRTVAVNLYGKKDEKDDISLPEIEEQFKKSFQ